MKKQLVIVDDDEAVRDSVSKVLLDSGYEVFAAAGVQEFSTLQGKKIDLLLLDLNLGSDSGWDICEDVLQKTPSMPVLIITGLVDQRFTALAEAAGAVLEKPLDPSRLLQTIEELLQEPEEKRLRRALAYFETVAVIPRVSASYLDRLSGPTCVSGTKTGR